jgi:superfamily II DNA or RNA helicase
VEFETDELVRKAVDAMKRLPEIRPVEVRFTTAATTLQKAGVAATPESQSHQELRYKGPLPDLLAYLQAQTDLTRSTLQRVAAKFLSLGILKNEGLSILKTSVERPVVCSLQHIPTSVSEVDDLLSKAQVFVTTSAIAGQCSKEVRDRLAEKVPYLFIDEAHHAEAPTWKTFKGGFSASCVVQFTATPFREDDKPLDGRIVFKYSLKQAQLDGYFKPIHFDPVTDFDQSAGDRKITEKAVACLRRDFAKGHVVMARVATVARAKEVYALYEQYPEFNPVQLHTGLTLKQQSEGRKKILAGESRIVVCVDMLGEGFDLPELKIAAFHDIRKSLAVTLQLAGRFTRTRPDLGEATFIANDADVNVRDELRKLYSKDPDWNVLLPDMAEKITGEQASLQELVRGFTAFPEEIALNVVRPATSAVVYRTTCSEWHSDAQQDGNGTHLNTVNLLHLQQHTE